MQGLRHSSDASFSASANVVYMNGISGRVVNAVTDEWARFDLTFLKPAEFARATGPMSPLFNRNPAGPKPQAPLASAPAFTPRG